MDISVQKKYRINKVNLNPNEYLISLMEAGYAAGLIDQSQANRIQAEIMDLLTSTIMKYTCAESTSVKVETAEKLLISILYCVDTYCLGFSDPEACLTALQRSDMKTIYALGQECISNLLDETKSVFQDVIATRLETPLVAYNTSINGITGFFAAYHPTFHAHETPADIDYPLAADDQSLRGVWYIRQYLQNLLIENEFCQHFEPDEIDRLLNSYGKTYHIDYAQFLLNIFEIVLTNAVFSLMLGKRASNLSLSASELDRLGHKLLRLKQDEIGLVLDHAIAKLIEEFNFIEPHQSAYIYKCAPNLRSRLINALEIDRLSQLAIVDRSGEEWQLTSFEQDQLMDNESLRQLIANVLACTDPSVKAEIILSRVKTLTDFLEVLQSDCLFDDDYRTLFEKLEDMELSLLLQALFADDLREGPINLSSDRIFHHADSDENPEWARHLIRLLQEMDPVRLKSLEVMINPRVSFME